MRVPRRLARNSRAPRPVPGQSSSGRLNVAILGDTGVGKSSLVNAIFHEAFALTGMGAPVTKGVDYYLKGDATLGVWDFEGFEYGDETPLVQTLRQRLHDNRHANDERTIHVAWFCWDASSLRVTDGHRSLIEALRDAEIPVIGVLTKFSRTEKLSNRQQREFAEWIEKQNLGLANARMYVTAVLPDADFGLIDHGVNDLLDATMKIARNPNPDSR